MTKLRVLITCAQMQACLDDFRPEFDARDLQVDVLDVVQQPTEEELIDIIGSYDGIIAGDDPLTDRVLSHAERLRVISKWGVGLDGIDQDSAAARGILVTNTPGVFGEDVADVAAGYLVMLARQLHRIHDSVSAGQWWKHEGVRLAGKTLGVVGFGSIGRAVARRGKGFEMHVLACDVSSEALVAAAEFDAEAVSFEELLSRSDFVVLCTPLTTATHHLFNESTIQLMKAGSFLVNVARGPLVDETALVAALESGRVAAAALDVFEEEPLAADHPLRAFEQCVFGSHNGSNTTEGVRRASELAVQNLFAGLGAP